MQNSFSCLIEKILQITLMHFTIRMHFCLSRSWSENKALNTQGTQIINTWPHLEFTANIHNNIFTGSCGEVKKWSWHFPLHTHSLQRVNRVVYVHCNSWDIGISKDFFRIFHDQTLTFSLYSNRFLHFFILWQDFSRGLSVMRKATNSKYNVNVSLATHRLPNPIICPKDINIRVSLF